MHSRNASEPFWLQLIGSRWGIFLAAWLLAACSDEKPERWIKLAHHYDPIEAAMSAPLDSFRFSIPDERWIWKEDAKLWSAPMDPRVAALRSHHTLTPSLEVDGRILTKQSRADTTFSIDKFWISKKRVTLAQGSHDPIPSSSSIVFTMDSGKRIAPKPFETSTAWRVSSGSTIADGFRVGPNSPVEFFIPIEANSTLRLSLDYLVAGPNAGDERRSFQILAGEQLLFEQPADDLEQLGNNRLAIDLPVSLGPRRPLRFRVQGSDVIATIHSPVIHTPGTKVAAKRDVIFISADTFRADNLACYGGDPQIAPHLNQFAEQSVRFENSWSAAIWTLPSHASLLLGLYPYEHGSVHTSAFASPELPSLAEHMSAAGYRTVAVTDGRYVSDTYGLDRGFESFLKLNALSADDTIRNAFDALDADDGRPLFLFLHSYQVHTPYYHSEETRQRLGKKLRLSESKQLIADVGRTLLELRAQETAKGAGGRNAINSLLPREDWSGIFNRVLPVLVEAGAVSADSGREEVARCIERLYLGGLAEFDAQIGRLFDGLKSRGKEQDTFVLLTSDHGEAFDEHGLYFHSRGTWDEVLRVPLLIRGPGLGAGAHTQAASGVDIAPTITSLVDVNPDSGWSGHSLFSHPAGPEAQFVVGFDCARLEEPSLMLIDGPWKLSTPLASIDDSAIAPRSLFNLEADPGEQRNLIQSDPERATLLLDRWRSTIEASLVGRATAMEAVLSQKELLDLEALGYIGE